MMTCPLQMHRYQPRSHCLRHLVNVSCSERRCSCPAVWFPVHLYIVLSSRLLYTTIKSKSISCMACNVHKLGRLCAPECCVVRSSWKLAFRTTIFRDAFNSSQASSYQPDVHGRLGSCLWKPAASSLNLTVVQI